MGVALKQVKESQHVVLLEQPDLRAVIEFKLHCELFVSACFCICLFWLSEAGRGLGLLFGDNLRTGRLCLGLSETMSHSNSFTHSFFCLVFKLKW